MPRSGALAGVELTPAQERPDVPGKTPLRADLFMIMIMAVAAFDLLFRARQDFSGRLQRAMPPLRRSSAAI